ncbi:hypothetical protein [Granulibacter bethesdensis]|uniref:hypothetical protein n=1 Tax=Granulibacter bethesdensis TaxID=364410 RepID=UPI0003F1E205|nr:hypothetical protein [Granulibacter bethesdensis]AHJ64665.1 Hypothetical protein GbCGDNIH4_7089 [Granulibacter bethesdensis CGDNIH4]
MAALPPIAVDQNRIFVHAGVDPVMPLEFQIERDLLWSWKSNHFGHQGRFIVTATRRIAMTRSPMVRASISTHWPGTPGAW